MTQLLRNYSKNDEGMKECEEDSTFLMIIKIFSSRS